MQRSESRRLPCEYATARATIASLAFCSAISTQRFWCIVRRGSRRGTDRPACSASSASAAASPAGGERLVDVDAFRDRMREVMLREKSAQYPSGELSPTLLGKPRLIAQMAAAANHREVETEHAAVVDDDNDIDVLATPGFDELFVLYAT